MDEEKLELISVLSQSGEFHGLEERAISIMTALVTAMDCRYSTLFRVVDSNLTPWLTYDRLADQSVLSRTEFRPVSSTGFELVTLNRCLNALPDRMSDTATNSIYPVGDADIKSDVTLPMRFRDDLRWVLWLGSGDTGCFSDDQEGFYASIANVLSMVFSDAYASEEEQINREFDEIVRNAWRDRLNLGHVPTIAKLMSDYAGIATIPSPAVFLLCVGDQDNIVEIAKPVDGQNPIRIVRPETLDFSFDQVERQWKPNSGVVAEPLRNHTNQVIGYFKSHTGNLSHFDLVSILNSKMAKEIESLLEEDTDRRAANLRRKILSFELEYSTLTAERFEILRELIKEQCGLGELHLWIVDKADPDWMYLDTNPELRVHRSQGYYLKSVWDAQSVRFKMDLHRDDPHVFYKETVPVEPVSWLGFPLVRGGGIAGIIACMGTQDNILTVQDLPAIELASIVLSTEMDVNSYSQQLLSSRFIESHQVSAHLQNAVSRTTLMARQMASGDRSRLAVHLSNITAFLRLAVRALNWEGRPLDQIGQLEVRRGSVLRCVAETVSMVRALLHGVGHDVQIRYDDITNRRRPFSYDALQESLLAVLLNAAKYSRAGGTVEINFDSRGSGRLEIKNLGMPYFLPQRPRSG